MKYEKEINKMTNRLLILFIGVLLMTSTSRAMNAQQKDTRQTKSAKMIDDLSQFKMNEKFVEDTVSFYPGLQNENLKSILSNHINSSADDFIQLLKTKKTTDTDFQNAIKMGLDRFRVVYFELDTEERERICTYYEELMDIVELESSDGHLNKFMYGFDPMKK